MVCKFYCWLRSRGQKEDSDLNNWAPVANHPTFFVHVQPKQKDLVTFICDRSWNLYEDFQVSFYGINCLSPTCPDMGLKNPNMDQWGRGCLYTPKKSIYHSLWKLQNCQPYWAESKLWWTESQVQSPGQLGPLSTTRSNSWAQSWEESLNKVKYKAQKVKSKSLVDSPFSMTWMEVNIGNSWVPISPGSPVSMSALGEQHFQPDSLKY